MSERIVFQWEEYFKSLLKVFALSKKQFREEDECLFGTLIANWLLMNQNLV